MAKATKQTALTKWDEKLAKKAAAQAAAEVLGSSPSISIKGGQMTMKGARLPGDKGEFIIVASVFDNTFRKGKYDPDNFETPCCFAFLPEADASGVTQKNLIPITMKPHAESTDPQADSCAECEHNEFGSADVGRGKACRQGRNLIVISAESENIETAELFKLPIPPTSLKAWKGYVNQLNDTLHRPTMSVVTEIKTVIQGTYPAVEFRLVEKIDDGDALDAIESREEEALKQLTQPYRPQEEKEQKTVSKQRKFAGKK